VNWWWFDFRQAAVADAPAYEEVLAGDLQPASEPIELPRNREFTVLDPDGYKLLFFKRK